MVTYTLQSKCTPDLHVKESAALSLIVCQLNEVLTDIVLSVLEPASTQVLWVVVEHH